MTKSYWHSLGIGFIAGMRAMSAPALLSYRLSRTIPTEHPKKPIQYLTNPKVATALEVLAAGELIGDKLPNAPNRTAPPQFISRIAMGVTCGAVVSEVEGQPKAIGAVLGGLGTIAGTLLFFNYRRYLDHDLGIPDTVGALVEDALTIGAGLALVNDIQPKTRLT